MKQSSTLGEAEGQLPERGIPPITSRPGRMDCGGRNADADVREDGPRPESDTTNMVVGNAAAPRASGSAATPWQSLQRQGARLEVITQDAIPPDSANSRRLPELLFVHGAWHGAWCWARMQTACSLAGFRSHALSLRGHGGSTGHEYLARIHLDDYVADVAHVAHELDAPFVLVGHSMGGLIAQRYLFLLDQGHDLPRPAGVVLLATALPADMALAQHNPSMTRYFGGQWGMMRTMFKMQLTGDTMAFVSSPDLVRTLFFTSETSEQDVIDCFIRLQNESMAVFRDTRRFARIWQIPLCAGIPLLVLGGSHDACFPPAAQRRLAAAYGATLHLFAGLGHDLMLDHGWEQVSEAITEWMQGLPAGQARAPTHVSPHHGRQVIPLRPLLAPCMPQQAMLVDETHGAVAEQFNADSARDGQQPAHTG